jgi:beta-glucosidase
MQGLPQGKAAETIVPLRCFATGGAAFNTVGAPFRLQAAAGLVATIRSIRIEPAAPGSPCP